MDRKAVSDKIKELLETVKVLGGKWRQVCLDKSEDGDGAMSITLCRDWTDFWAANIAVMDQGDECRCIDKIDGMYILLPLAVRENTDLPWKKCKAPPVPALRHHENQPGPAKIRRWQEFILFVLGRDVSQRTFQTVFRSNTLAVRDCGSGKIIRIHPLQSAEMTVTS